MFMRKLNRKANVMMNANDNDGFDDTGETLRALASWAVALALACALVVWSVNADAQTAPCAAHKGCTIERDSGKQRSALEGGGLVADPSDAVAAPAEQTRYWLRCWQRGQLITERVVYSLPVESRAAKPLTDHAGSSVIAFDLKNAMCIAESLATGR
jgi:hypothetical protein